MAGLFILGLLAHIHLPIVVGTHWSEPLGKGFYLPGEEIGMPHLGGSSIFKTLPNSCFHKTTDRSTTNQRSIFDNTRSFYSSVSTDAGLAVTLMGKFTMGFTLATKTRSLSSGETQIAGTSIDIWNHVSTAIIDKDCMTGSGTSLSDNLINSLNALHNVERPEVATSWTKYQHFLHAYGSHVVTHTFYGASIKQWTFSRKEEKYTQEQMNIRSCADFAGTTTVCNLNISSACIDITQDQVEAVKDLHTLHENSPLLFSVNVLKCFSLHLTDIYGP